MIITSIPSGKIVSNVMKAVKNAEKEILTTMLLSEELKNPLPETYHRLLVKKTNLGVRIERLGFGSKEAYNQINSLHVFSQNYNMKHIRNEKRYQRMIIIDKKILFFNIEGNFFTSTYEPLVKAFVTYFKSV